MRLKKYAILESVYMVSAMIFLFKLGQLNRTLLSKQFASVFELLSYEGYRPIYYFLGSIVVVLIGVGLSIYYFRAILLSRNIEAREILIAALSIAINVALIFGTCIAINNPILRAIIVAAAAIVGGMEVARDL